MSELTGRIKDMSIDFATDKTILSLVLNEKSVAASMFNDLKDAEKLKIKISKYREKRSLDANAYCWTLLHKLAAKRGREAEDIYRDYIKDFGVCEIVPIREDAIKRWESIWKSKGYGWITEDMGECRNTKGYHNIKCFYGSSSYTTLEMSQLIDAIVQDCKEQGIDTETPDQIERMKAAWQSS